MHSVVRPSGIYVFLLVNIINIVPDMHQPKSEFPVFKTISQVISQIDHILFIYREFGFRLFPVLNNMQNLEQQRFNLKLIEFEFIPLVLRVIPDMLSMRIDINWFSTKSRVVSRDNVFDHQQLWTPMANNYATIMDTHKS